MIQKSKVIKMMKDLFEFITTNIEKSKISRSNKQLIIDEVTKLKSFVLNARPARIAIVGRRGAGKSSLINAIFGELRAEVGDVKSQTGRGTWYSFTNETGGIDILDTRGLGESSTPEEDIYEATPVEEIKKAVQDQCPDVIMFLCKAKEVDARLEEDLHQLQQLQQTIEDVHLYNIPIIGVVTQVDELAPLSNMEPPFDHPEKQKNIAESVEVLRKRISDSVTTPVHVIPVAAYLEFSKEKIVYDRRWNIDGLIEYLLKELPQEAQVILAKIAKIKSVQKKLSRTVAKSVMGVTGVIGASPIPIADMPVITSLQMSMVGTIAIISGQKLNRQSIVKFVGAMGVNIGVGLAFREIARQLVKVIPIAGNLVSGAVATAGTYAISEAAIAYFIDRKPAEEAKRIFEIEMENHKSKNESIETFNDQ